MVRYYVRTSRCTLVETQETVNISDLRANLLKYLEKAGAGHEITVTTNGKVLAPLSTPVQKMEAARQQLEELAASATIHDVISPVKSTRNLNTPT